MPKTSVYFVFPSRNELHATSTMCEEAVSPGSPRHSEIASGICSTRSNTSLIPERGIEIACFATFAMLCSFLIVGFDFIRIIFKGYRLRLYAYYANCTTLLRLMLKEKIIFNVIICIFYYFLNKFVLFL